MIFASDVAQMTYKKMPVRFPRGAHGAVLFVALVFLILLTLLGLTAASNSVLQERMTGGMRNAQLGLMGAESAARGAEAWLWNLSNNNGKINCGYNGGDSGYCYSIQTNVGSDGTSTVLNVNPKIGTFRSSPTWLTSSTSGGIDYTQAVTSLSGSSETASLSQKPQYMLEYLGLLLPPGANSNRMSGSQTRWSALNRSSSGQNMYSYRITARSTGGSDASVRVVETYFGTGVPSN